MNIETFLKIINFEVKSNDLPQKIVEKLKEPLPQKALKEHGTKKNLSSISPQYIIDRLNDVFGVNGWHFHTEIVDKKDKMVVVIGYLIICEYGVLKQAYGGNDNNDLGDAYKGASTDALTKAASMIGIAGDVYKGLQSHKTKPTQNRQPATDKDIDAVIKLIKANEKAQARALLKNKALSGEQKKLLAKAADASK